jgi:glycosyltransferase involved in cell wall biosynthesis
MKIALVCDDLIQHGGQERLFVELTNMYPNADIFAPVLSKEWKSFFSRRGRRVHTSFMQHLSFIEKLNKLYAVFLLHVFALESFDFSAYDLVLSVSSRFAHHVVTRPQTTHICYMNSPGRMIWNLTEYFDTAGGSSGGSVGGRIFKKIIKGILKPVLIHLRLVDFTAAQRVDLFIANSKNVQNRIRKYYKKESTVIYPFVNSVDFSPATSSPAAFSTGSYFLAISRLVNWKRLDLVVKACSTLNLPLKVVGEGPAAFYLRSLAGESVEFLGYVTEEQKQKLLSTCIALVHPQEEDFGITPLEALACGKPVIAYGRGGVLETVIPGETGEYFTSQTEASLSKVLQQFNPKKYDSKKCRARAVEFDIRAFRYKIKEFVLRVYT